MICKERKSKRATWFDEGMQMGRVDDLVLARGISGYQHLCAKTDAIVSEPAERVARSNFT